MPRIAISSLGDIARVSSSGPYFIPDIYEKDLGPAPAFDALAANGRMVGCILKATEGVRYSPSWFTVNWQRVRDAAPDRYGDSWFRGCYHFGRPDASGRAQADFLLSAVERAGGWGDSDMPPAWDLEGQIWSSAQQIVDVSTDFCERIKSETGKDPILYSGSLIRDMPVTDHMGFASLWTPRANMASANWYTNQYCLLQYLGDGKFYDPSMAQFGWPTSVSGWGATDMSVVLDMETGSPANDIDTVRRVLLGRRFPWAILLVAGIAGLAAWRFLKTRR
jgi:hypothetical protein